MTESNSLDRFLTVREAQQLLKVDRVTVYRMLRAGRLKGVKVGHQWRFPRAEFDAMLSCGCQSSEPVALRLMADASFVLPLDCVQATQDAFADIAGVGAVTVSPDGTPLTGWSNPCEFCMLVQESRAGRQGCALTWMGLAARRDLKPGYTTCHAGLQCLGASIDVEGSNIGTLVAGQFYAEAPDRKHEARRLRALADNFQVDAGALVKASGLLPVLDPSRRRLLGTWARGIARAIEAVTREHLTLLDRRRKLTAITILE